SSVESPVPPPMATTRSPRRSTEREAGFFAVTETSIRNSIEDRGSSRLRATTRASERFRIEEFGKARIVRHVVEVRIAARLNAVLRIQLNRLVQMVQALLSLPGDAVQYRQPVVRVIRHGVFLQQALELVARVFIIACVQQRNGVVVLLLCASKGQPILLSVALAHRQVGPRPLQQFRRSVMSQLFKKRARLVELPFLHPLHGVLVLRE